MTDATANAPDASRRILLALQEARTRLDVADRAVHEPIAVVGIGCRFPGGAAGPEAFWTRLLDGSDPIRPVPTDRYDAASLFDPRPGTPGRIYSCHGAWLDDVDRFDPAFFGISPREALSLDPQQRLLLEVAWEALEHGGQAPGELRGSRSGIFIGIGRNDYGHRFLRAELDTLTAWHATGNGLCYGPGRLAHVLDLRGPNMAMDTACSSSLLAVHLACQSLRARECDLALAGGCHLHLSPQVAIMLSMSHALAPDGRSKAFDAAADGFGQGEGCGLIVLRRLSDAQARGDTIHGLIRGSAVNHDGHSSGLTVPNQAAQEQVIRDALAHARVRPGDIGFVEAHGTGTRLGDPIELEALAEILCRERRFDAPLLVGSVKANIGHLEAAAGIAGLIKAVLALRQRMIPPHPHFRTPNPNFDWPRWAIRVPTRATPWQQADGGRYAGVSSFGMSGTNVHVVLQEPPEADRAIAATGGDGAERPLHAVMLSARTLAALREQARRWDERLVQPDPPALADLAFTANTGRSHFAARAGLVAGSLEQLRGLLRALAAGRSFPRVLQPAEDEDTPGVVFLFSGQGSQRVGMGRQLYRSQPLFRRVLDQCDAILRPLLRISLCDLLLSDGADDRLTQTRYAQPALFALECALTELWRSWGVVPSAVLGHSVGEYAAALAAGVFGLEDGLRLIAERARLMQEMPPGAMAMVPIGEEEARTAIASHGAEVGVAAVNGAAEVVLSGHPASLRAVLARLVEQTGATARALPVSHAFHSPMMQPVLAPFAEAAQPLRYAPPRVPLGANVTGDWHRGAPTAAYWAEHIRQPVRFARNLDALAALGHRICIEIGPGSTLLAIAGRHLASRSLTLLPSLSSRHGEWQSILEALARLHEHGVAIDWAGFESGHRRRRVALPTYPFERQSFWSEDVAAPRALPPLRELPAYRLAWLEQPPVLQPPRAPPRTRHWLVLADPTGTGDRLARLLASRGESWTRVERGSGMGPSRATGGCWRVDPAHPDGLRPVLETISRPACPVNVVYLWDCEAEAGSEPTADRMLATQMRRCGGLLHLVQLLVREPGPYRLWIVTRNATAGDATAAALWSMGRVVALEHPGIWGGMIDLEGAPAEADAALLLRELEAEGAEDQRQLRDGRRLVARVQAVPAPAASYPPLRLKPDAVYLVTGGLGALGLRVAGWMVERGARRVVLLGRKRPTLDAELVLEAMRRQGARIDLVTADVADAEDLRHALAGLAATPPGLRGVVHAAGAIGHRALEELDEAALYEVLRAKLAGGWLLHRLTAHLELDFFVCFSSVAALWGSKGQAHYAAANGFLDGLAALRRQQGLPALSLAWGPWAGGGMTNEVARSQLARIGIRSLDPTAALSALERYLVAGEDATVAVADVDWARLQEFYTLGRPRTLLANLLAGAPAVDAAAPPIAEPREAWAELPADERQDRFMMQLQGVVAQVLGLPDGALPDVDTGFFRLGMDSLMAIELRDRLSQEFGTRLAATLAFDHPTVRMLTAHFAEQVLGWDPNPAREGDPEREMMVAKASPESLASKLRRLETLMREL
jgi:acyl transferase domain-containing protein/acyl carrier protein